MQHVDHVSVGTTLCHPDGECVVTGETRTSWKVTRRGHEYTIAKDTMVARGGLHMGYSGYKYITKARHERKQAEDLMRKRLTHLMAVSELEALTTAVAALET